MALCCAISHIHATVGARDTPAEQCMSKLFACSSISLRNVGMWDRMSVVARSRRGMCVVFSVGCVGALDGGRRERMCNVEGSGVVGYADRRNGMSVDWAVMVCLI